LGINVLLFPAPTIIGSKKMLKVTLMLYIFPCGLLASLNLPTYIFSWELLKKHYMRAFNKFGGSARFILTTDLKFFEREVVSLEKAFSIFFKSYEQLLEACEIAKENLASSPEMLRLCHRLFYYVPSEDFESVSDCSWFFRNYGKIRHSYLNS
jgi:uncharacterized membrane-anchored protein YitT (DUF2179 family)